MELNHRAATASLVLLAAVTIAAPGLAIAAQTNPESFSQNHQMWDQGADILALQQFLNSNGFLLASSGTGSPGHETEIFGPRTYQALKQFQSAHGLPATGYLGPLTRAAIAAIAGASVTQQMASSTTSTPFIASSSAPRKTSVASTTPEHRSVLRHHPAVMLTTQGTGGAFTLTGTLTDATSSPSN
jgi:peptidoglycan hydrolase-like protein with peptidoglycan-binding domain